MSDDKPIRFIIATHGVYTVSQAECDEIMSLTDDDEGTVVAFKRMLDEREAVYKRVMKELA